MAKINKLLYEKKYWRAGFGVLIGLDEAGRGPLAGPVSAAAVALIDFDARDASIKRLLREVDDSKKLSAEKREELYGLIVRCAQIAWSAAIVGPETIDRINILEASKLAMRKAVFALVAKLNGAGRQKIYCLTDGNFSIKVPYAQTAIIAGDGKVFSIAAASIVAKVTRDRIMEKMDKKYRAYGFARHKGYPTKEHLAALAGNGLSPIHRESFGPCAAILRKAIIKI